MIEFETIQEEVLNELFGTTNFASTIRGIFTGKTPDTALNPTKKVLDRKLNAANRIQRASGFLSDKSLNDVDIPTFLRKAMEKGADASKPEQSALRKTGYKVGPPGHNVYGKVGGAADTVSAETLAAAEKRRAVYTGKSYASIRETPDQTVRRLLKEMQLNEWKITPQLADRDYRQKVQDRAWKNYTSNLNNEDGRANPSRKTRALRTASQFITSIDDAHSVLRHSLGKALWNAMDNTTYDNIGADKSERVGNDVVEAHSYDKALIYQIVEELLEAFMYDPKHHFTGGREGGVPGPLSGMKFDTLQRALDAGAQLTPSGQPMGDWNHVIVAPEDTDTKKVEAPKPPAEAAPEGDVQDKLDPIKRIQPLAAPVK